MKYCIIRVSLIFSFYLYSLNLAFISAQSTPTACNRKADSSELVKLFQNLDGLNWTNKTNWLKPGKPMNTWYGITLSVQGCVKTVHLDNNNLSGKIYDFLLPNLLTLSLNSNKIEGSLPDFSNLPVLDTLSLTDNKISGALPDFQNLSQLKYLDVGTNDLSGGIQDFSKLPNLSVLNIFDNKLTGSIPDFKNLVKLEQLWADGNQFSGQIPDFSNIPEMGSLYLTRNKFTGVVPAFSKIPKVWFLDVSENNLSGKLPAFSNMPKLWQLGVVNCNLTGEVPFLDLPNLHTLYLRVNKFTGNMPDLSNLTNLDFIDIGSNQLSGPIPSFDNMPNLTSVWLYDNNFSGPIPNTPFIKWFHYWDNNFTFSNILSSGKTSATYYYAPQKEFFKDTVIQVLKNKPLLIDLGIDKDLKDNNYQLYLSKNNLLYLQSSQDSNKIYFSSPQSTQSGRYVVRVTNPNLPLLSLFSKTISLRICDQGEDSLELVKLYNSTGGANWTNHTNWLIPNKAINSWFGIKTNNLGCVQKIDLSNNNLVGSMPLINMSNLDTAILQNNTMNGKIPEINIPFIKMLDLSHNQLNGEFPKSLTNWNDIRNLNLGNNKISGAVPPDLGDLCELRNLRINNNKIAGELPESLTMLTNLEIGQVDFSHNDIDSLKNKIIWFCPFGDSIFKSNPSYDRFLGICNVKCNGNEFNSLKDFPWIVDTINQLNCKQGNCVLSTVHAGFVDVRGIRVFYTHSRCYQNLNTPVVFNEVVHFYDCGGHLLETVTNDDAKKFKAEFGAITLADFENLKYDTKWQCGQILNLISSTKEIGNKNINSISKNTFSLECSPNPVSEFLSCDLSNINSPIQLQIVDPLGQTYTVPFRVDHDHLEMNVSNLSSGLYIISLQSKTGSKYLSRIIIQR